MKKIGSYIVIFCLKACSLLPLWYLLFCSRMMFVVLYYVFGYRKKVVRANLTNSFPQKTTSELRSIESKYYLHLCDLVFENIWAIRASEKQIQKHCPIIDIDVFKDQFSKNKNFICLLGHVGNWEWCSLSYNTYHLNPLLALYRPIKDKPFDDFFLKFRSRFGSTLVPMNQLARVVNENHEAPYVLAFIADQSPVPEYAYWTNFLNQDTCFFNGYDKVARKKEYPVVFAYLQKVRRGYYQMKVELLTKNSSSLSENEITQLYASRLDSVISDNPAHWLWSHKRWKHKKPQ